MRRAWWLVLGVVSVAAATGWWLFRRGVPVIGARVVMEWRGSRVGSVTLPGQVSWCPITRVATLEAISNDTGLVVTLLETDSMSAGVHTAVVPELRDASPRPSAVAALRWVVDGDTLVGFRSVSGVVDLRPAGATASGSFDLRMRAPVGIDTLVLRGSFRALPVTTGAVGCP